jgi:hypothetical protein
VHSSGPEKAKASSPNDGTCSDFDTGE